MAHILLIEEWCTNTGIDPWDNSRKKINEVIKLFNEWQTKHWFDKKKGLIVLAMIDMRYETFKQDDYAGHDYFEELDTMKNHINKQLENEIRDKEYLL